MIAWSTDGTNTMTAVRDEAVPQLQQLRIRGVYVTRLIFWLVLMLSQLKEIITLNDNLT